MGIDYRWRGDFGNQELNALHAEAFGHAVLDDDWRSQVECHSLGWVCAREDGGKLVGFANVPWDGAAHAFLIDSIVAVRSRRQGIATRMVAICVEQARAAGCEWLHVDFDDHLERFYIDSCGFTPTPAGLIRL